MRTTLDLLSFVTALDELRRRRENNRTNLENARRKVVVFVLRMGKI